MTIKDIALAANVSTATVSRIMNGDYSSVGVETKERVLSVARQANYVPRKKRNAVSRKVALIAPEISQPFFSSIIEEVSRFCMANSFEMMLYCTESSQAMRDKVIENIISSEAEWILDMGASGSEGGGISKLISSGRKVILLDNTEYPIEIPVSILVDGESGMYDMTSLLLENGHTGIAYISGSTGRKFFNNRHAGYARALFGNNIVVDPQLTRFGEFTFESGYKCTEDLFALGKEFTAIVCENDLIAYGAIKALRQHGLRVPEDVSVTGFDDMSFSKYMDPALTTIKQPMKQMIEKAFEIFKRMGEGEAFSNYYLKFPPQIIERGSVTKI